MNKKKTLIIFLFSVLFMVLIGCYPEQQTLVTIDGERYTVADFDERFQFAPTDDSLSRISKIDEFVNQMCVVAEAQAQHYDEDPIVKTAYETHRKNIIYNSYYEDKVINSATVSETEIKERYNKIIDQYHLAQIVVDQDTLAHRIAAELKQGTPFDSLLRFSLDTLSDMGDIGFFSVVTLPPEILEVVENTEIGKTTDAIKFGEFYYILKVIEHKISDTPTYDKVKEHIQTAIKREKVNEAGEKFIEELLKGAKVEYNQIGLDILLKPDSLITEADLDVCVVKKYDTAYVRVRTIRDAVMYQYRQSFVDPKQLIDRVLVPDLIYDKAIKEYYDKKSTTKHKLRHAMITLMYQKYYSDNVLEKVECDSSDVAEYYQNNKEKFKDKTFEEAFALAKSNARTAKIDLMRQQLYDDLREKYNPSLNQEAVATLLKEE